MAYNTYPAVDDSTLRFPPGVRSAIATSPEVVAAIESRIPDIPDTGSTVRVKVVTGLEVRPNVDFVIWLGGTSRPANMFEGDVQLTTAGIAPPTPPSITTSSFNSMSVGAAFNQIMSASGVGPFTWGATGLPAGLTMNSSGVLSGTPTTVSSGSAIVSCTNSGGTATRTISWSVSATATAPVIAASPAPPAGQTGVAYAWTPGRSGSTPMAWGVSVGSLPPGLTINSSTGALSGTPTTAGTYAFTLQATNSAGSGTRSFSITVALAPADIITVFGSTAPAEPLSYTDGGAGSWYSHMFYVPASGGSLETSSIVGARLYIPAGSSHIGQTWRAAVVTPTAITGSTFGGQSQYDSNGTKAEGSVLIAGWNEVNFPAEYAGPDNSQAFMIGIQIGDGTRYVHVATGMTTAFISAPGGANFVLAEAALRSWYRDDQFDSTLWYGIDVKVRTP